MVGAPFRQWPTSSSSAFAFNRRKLRYDNQTPREDFPTAHPPVGSWPDRVVILGGLVAFTQAATWVLFDTKLLSTAQRDDLTVHAMLFSALGLLAALPTLHFAVVWPSRTSATTTWHDGIRGRFGQVFLFTWAVITLAACNATFSAPGQGGGIGFWFMTVPLIAAWPLCWVIWPRPPDVRQTCPGCGYANMPRRRSCKKCCTPLAPQAQPS